MTIRSTVQIKLGSQILLFERQPSANTKQQGTYKSLTSSSTVHNVHPPFILSAAAIIPNKHVCFSLNYIQRRRNGGDDQHTSVSCPIPTRTYVIEVEVFLPSLAPPEFIGPFGVESLPVVLTAEEATQLLHHLCQDRLSMDNMEGAPYPAVADLFSLSRTQSPQRALESSPTWPTGIAATSPTTLASHRSMYMSSMPGGQSNPNTPMRNLDLLATVAGSRRASPERTAPDHKTPVIQSHDRPSMPSSPLTSMADSDHSPQEVAIHDNSNPVGSQPEIIATPVQGFLHQDTHAPEEHEPALDEDLAESHRDFAAATRRQKSSKEKQPRSHAPVAAATTPRLPRLRLTDAERDSLSPDEIIARIIPINTAERTQWPCPLMVTSKYGNRRVWCTQICGSKGDLERHLQSKGHKVSRLQCRYCSRSYTRKDALKRHHELSCKGLRAIRTEGGHHTGR